MPQIVVPFCVVAIFLFGLQDSAQAVQWQTLNGTSRHKVSYDEQSIRLTSQGRLEVWLRFVPRGEPERKSAATEYKEKRYRYHLEYYEIDCSEQTAILGLIDVFGVSRVRLKRLKGDNKADQILPGSVLENAARQICPVLDEENEETGDTVVPDQAEEPGMTDDTTPNSDTLLQIEKLLKKTTSKEATAETWKELGNIYFDTDQPELAIKAYERSLALRPDDTDTLNDQGAMYRQKGDFKRALINFERACSLDPNNLESLYNSGYIYAFDLNDIPKALIIWRKYLAIESKSETAVQVQSFINQYGK